MGTLRGPSPGTVNLAGIGIACLAGGILLLAGTVIGGTLIGRTETKGFRIVDPRTRVLARYALDKRGAPAIVDWDFDDPSLKYYVRLQTGTGHVAEYRCARAVFDQCGEGMAGESHLQGRWLGLFKPYIGSPQPDSSPHS